MIIDAEHDPMGQAIADFFSTGKAKRLRVCSPQLFDDVMPVDNLFRTYPDMPPLEQQALDLCQGRVLDVGAGAGCHSLELQQKGFDVTAIDISPRSVATMRERGITQVQCADFFTDTFGTGFHTILFLMNGLGIAGRLSQLPALLTRAASLLAEGGSIIADSSDLRYLYEDEAGHFDWDEADGYYGEITYKMVYGKCQGQPFSWLYVDYLSLCRAAAQVGLQCELIATGSHYDYLARITRAPHLAD